MSKMFYDYSITSNYGNRVHPITGQYKKHNGIDYALPLNTDVLSNVQGTVVTSNYNDGGYGNLVIVKDKSGKMHYYAHLNSRNVSVGDTVGYGDLLGKSGSTGNSTGAHLHYEVRNSNNQSINPSSYTKISILDNSPYTENGFTGWTDSIPSSNEIIDTAIEKTGIKEKVKSIVFELMKWIILILLIVLSVVCLTMSLDIDLI